jgi:hypothetical protein
MITYTNDAQHAIDKMNAEAVKIQNQHILNALRDVEGDLFEVGASESAQAHAMECTEAFARHMVASLGFCSKDTDYLA